MFFDIMLFMIGYFLVGSKVIGYVRVNALMLWFAFVGFEACSTYNLIIY